MAVGADASPILILTSIRTQAMRFYFELNLQMPKSKLAVSNKIGLLYSIETKQLEEQIIG